VERRLKLTRGCLKVLVEFRNPVMVITKNALVARDMDVLADLAAHDCASVMLSIPTLDVPLNRALEPRTSLPRQRLGAIGELARAGVPVGVLTAPVIPGLTDSEVPGILKAAAEAGATFAGFEILRLPFGVKDLFAQWLEDHMPDRKDKVLNRVRAMRGGKLNDPAFGARMRGQGPFAEQVAQLFHAACRKHGLNAKRSELSTAAFRRPGQLELF
jgi:DNA repair photolyase